MMASYLYYHRYTSLLKDEDYDQLAYILLRDYDLFDHIHKHLITQDMLRAGTTYNLREYPLRTKCAAESFLEKNDDT